MKVMKFGGAALQDAAGIRNVAAIVAAQTGPRVVVTSAMQGVTDLLAGVAAVPPTEAQVHVLMDTVRRRHAEVLGALDADDAARYAVATGCEQLERLLYGIAYTGELTPRLGDLVQSFGERLAVPLVAAALRSADLSALHLDAEDAGILALGPFGNARPDLPGQRRAVPAALEPLLAAGTVPVVTGYYGIDPDGHPALFGRGGSDYVASLVARAMDAEHVELWKDVPGFLTTDPKAVPGARLVPELGYDEASELAHFGAKVLHARAVEPVQPRVPIHIRSFQDPSAPGSVVCQDPADGQGAVRACASKDGLALLHLNGPGMAYTPGVARRVFEALDGINILNMSTSQATFALLLDEADLDAAQEALAPLIGGVIQSVDARGGYSLVCVVGRGLGETPGSAARILHSVADAGVNVEMISLGASDIAIDFIVASTDRIRALQGVHATFLEAP